MSLLRECQQGIELLEIRRFHDDGRRGRNLRIRLHQREHGIGGQCRAARQQHAQGVVDGRLAVVGRMMQNFQIFPGTVPLVAAGAEAVVGHAEPRRREQIVAVGIVRERARLADQRVNDVPVIDGVSVSAHQPRPRFHAPVRKPHLDAVGIEPRFRPLADQPAVHRVRVAVNVNQAAAVDATAHLQTRRQPRVGQVGQRPLFLGEAILTPRVPRLPQILEELRVVLAADEIAAAAEQQRLIDRGLEVPVRRLRIAVLVRLTHVDPLPRQAVVRQQIAITRLEFPLLGVIVDGGGQTVAAVPSRHAAQFPQRILQAVRERLKRLRRTHRHRFPVRVGQYEVVDQVIERLAGDGDVQGVHLREVRRGQIASLVNLAEHDGLARTVEGSPLLHAAFEGAALRIEEPPRMFAAQPVEQRLGEQPRLGLETRLDRRPDRGERIGPGAVGPRLLPLVGEPHAGQLALVAVVSGRLVVHACSPGRCGQVGS
jgi:hypothetical protein